MRRIFIYGVSGDIGHRTAQALVAKGHRVCGLVRSAAKAERLNTYGIETVVGDLTHATLVQHADWLAGIDVVMFSAGASSEEEDEVKAIDYQAVVISAAAAKQQTSQPIALFQLSLRQVVNANAVLVLKSIFSIKRWLKPVWSNQACLGLFFVGV